MKIKTEASLSVNQMTEKEVYDAIDIGVEITASVPATYIDHTTRMMNVRLYVEEKITKNNEYLVKCFDEHLCAVRIVPVKNITKIEWKKISFK